ncbi:MAG: TIGR02996 domain-containing protein [Kofleriaceae bacterium]
MRLENGSDYVEIERVGSSAVTIRQGRIGTRGETEEKRASADTIDDLYELTLRDWLRDGYKRPPGEVPPAVFSTREPALEQALRDHRGDRDAFAIYADWLQLHGNPVGELIAITMQREAGLAAPKLQKRYDAVHKQLRLPLPDIARMRWRYGMWQTLHVENARDYRTEGGRPPNDFSYPKIEQLFAHPLCAALERLEIGALHSVRNYALVPRVIAEAGKHAWARDLVSLEIGACHSDPDRAFYMSGYNAGPIGARIGNVFPKLRELTVWHNLDGSRDHTVDLSGLALPELRSLALRGAVARGKRVDDLAKVKAPKLERLEIWGVAGYRVPATIVLTPAHFEPVLDAFPHVVHLAIRNANNVIDFVRAVEGWKVAHRLRSIDFSQSVLGDAAVSYLVATRGAYQALEELVVENCTISQPALRQLIAVFPKVRHTPVRGAASYASPQWMPSDYRRAREPAW